MEEGVIFINEKCEIEFLNKYCKNIFNRINRSIVKKNIKEILRENHTILENLKMGRDYENLQVFIDNENKKGMYISIARAIKYDKNKTIGSQLY